MADMKDIHKTAVSLPKKRGAIVVVPVLRAKKTKRRPLLATKETGELVLLFYLTGSEQTMGCDGT